MPAPTGMFVNNLARLIAKFEADKAHYLSKDYPEAQAKIDFITPFFKALGWDVENEAGLLHHQREVIVERGETEGRPDYNFRIGGQTKFFVEAKAPSEPLDSVQHILHAKTYAWNTKQVFFVILTDFEDFRFYDGNMKPRDYGVRPKWAHSSSSFQLGTTRGVLALPRSHESGVVFSVAPPHRRPGN